MMMKSQIFFLLSVALSLAGASCAVRQPDEGALLLYARSRDLYREGRYAEAAEMLAGESSFGPALVLRGKAEYFSGDLAAARKSLKKAGALGPQKGEASLYYARVLRESGQSDEARKLIEELLSGSPSDLRALRFAAELAGERGVSGEAALAALLNRAVEASEEAAAESALVYLDRARLRWIGGNAEGALDDLGRAKALLGREGPLSRSLEKLESIISEVRL